MAKHESVIKIRKLSQQHAYTSIQLHEAIGKQMGLAGTDHKYLGFLLQKGTMTAGELALVTGLTTGAVTGLIDRLAKKKLVKRQLDKEDRRKVIIVPNIEKIVGLLEPYYADYQVQTDKLLASFTTAEQNAIEQYLEKALSMMNKKIDQLNTVPK
jgi:DNA-binding MarR family transcriptional regulator